MQQLKKLCEQALGGESNLTKCVQRDLEDQIEEEYRAQGREYKRVGINNSNNMSTVSKPTIVVQDVLDLLKKGYTRLKKDDLGFGSIQERYALSGADVKSLFAHPKLAKKKTIPPRNSFVLVDRDEPADVTQEITDELIEASDTLDASKQDVVVTSIAGTINASAEFINQRDKLFS